MCRSMTCRRCGKVTWAGCGNHVDQVMRGVPKDQRCTCDGTAVQGSPSATPQGGFWRRLIGR